MLLPVVLQGRLAPILALQLRRRNPTGMLPKRAAPLPPVLRRLLHPVQLLLPLRLRPQHLRLQLHLGGARSGQRPRARLLQRCEGRRLCAGRSQWRPRQGRRGGGMLVKLPAYNADGSGAVLEGRGRKRGREEASPPPPPPQENKKTRCLEQKVLRLDA